MTLTKEQIKSITKGALDIKYEGGRYIFERFTDAQKEYYAEARPEFVMKTRSTPGTRFDFYTDADEFGFSYDAEQGSGRTFYYFDTVVDGILVGHTGANNLDDPHGTVSVTLPAGEHRVTVWFPYLAAVYVKEVTVTDGAYLKPIPASRLMICYGDSITHGYDVLFPSFHYMSRLAEHFDADTVNQAIGGEVFCPGLLDGAPDIKPDIVTVAYGTNDWRTLERNTFENNCTAFLDKLGKRYPDAKIFVITPLWRADGGLVTKAGAFADAVAFIAEKAASYGYEVICGEKLTPHRPEFYSDRALHPNDLGFTEYSRNLISAMRI